MTDSFITFYDNDGKDFKAHSKREILEYGYRQGQIDALREHAENHLQQLKADEGRVQVSVLAPMIADFPEVTNPEF